MHLPTTAAGPEAGRIAGRVDASPRVSSGERRLRVGVSGINAVDNPGPGIAVARSLREDAELGVEVFGLAYDAMEPGVYMDWVVDRAFLMPYPHTGGEAYFDRLMDIQAQHGLDVVIPNLDAELPFYIRYASRLAERGVRTCLPTLEQFQLRGKDRLPELAAKVGLTTPRTEVVTSLEGLHRALGELSLPVYVKGAYYKAYRAHTRSEAVEHFHHLVADWGYPVIVQETVGGVEINVVGMGDGQGGLVGAVGVKKAWVTELGKMWTGITVRHPATLAAAEAFVRMSGWRGPFELECMTRGDEVDLIEINPRFPAWVYLATGVGVNLPAALVRGLAGLPVKAAEEYATGRLFVRYSYDLVTDMSRLQQMVTQGGAP